MARVASNALLHRAKQSKSDEFYTQYCDIERELQHYAGCFAGKVVYCNCDDPKISNFVRYFVDNFEALRLKRLLASCIHPKLQDGSQGLWAEYEGKDKPWQFHDFKGDGDFRSSECIELLERSDVVVTNPPFSLFRDFLSQLMLYHKHFLIIGNINAITYKEIFAHIKDNALWLGVHLGRGISGFIVPEHYELYGSEARINQERQRIVATNNCLWLTNLPVAVRSQKLKLTCSYYGHEDKYPTYDNCAGINVNRTKDIPYDYAGLMGVPITFLHKYNPEQFEIVRFRKGEDGKDLRINGKCPYFRILIRNRAVIEPSRYVL